MSFLFLNKRKLKLMTSSMCVCIFRIPQFELTVSLKDDRILHKWYNRRKSLSDRFTADTRKSKTNLQP